MRNTWTRAAIVAATLTFLASGEPACAQHARRTPIVEAVRKTRAGIVTVRTEQANGESGPTGTGFVVDERGYVVTSLHVVTEAVRVKVHLHDGTALTGRVAATEAATDLAVLRVTPQRPLMPLALGPSSDLMVGETVIAIGHPYGYTNTVSTGIVSALGRSITMPSGDTLGGVIQVNASINPGNSGGPLLNINGEIIGLNTAVRDGAQGIAFAVSSDAVTAMLSRHLSGRKLAQVRHGLTCAERVAEEEGPRRQRVVIAAVEPAAPAARAGLRPSDVLVSVAGRPVANRFDVERAIWDRRPGDEVEVKLLRDGREVAADLSLVPAAHDRLRASSLKPNGAPR